MNYYIIFMIFCRIILKIIRKICKIVLNCAKKYDTIIYKRKCIMVKNNTKRRAYGKNRRENYAFYWTN